MKNVTKFFYLFVLLLITNIVTAQDKKFTYSDNWGQNGYNLVSSKSTGINVVYSISKFSIVKNDIKGESLDNINLPGIYLFNNAGMPDLPGDGRMLAIPEGAKPTLKIVRYKTELIKDVNMAPAPVIPLDNEANMTYKKDSKVFSENKFYPENPIQISKVMQIRGVDFVTLGITPFQYNPVTKELLVYRDIEVSIEFEGGKGIFGDDRLRNIWWEPILQDALLNYNSLPTIDLNKKNTPKVAGECEYLIVVPNDPIFIAKAKEIKEFRSKQGILTSIVTTTEMGGNTRAAIENYINNAYNTWTTPPAAVLMMADYGTTGSTITSPLYGDATVGSDYCISDNIYADVDDDKLPDIVFARMTANNQAQLDVMVNKFINYETNPPISPSFYAHPITALGWQTERWFQICSEVIGGFWQKGLGKTPVRVNAVYEGNPAVDPWSSATNTTDVVNYFGPLGLDYIPTLPTTLGGWTGGNAAAVNTAINAGSFMLQHRDHGFEQGWGEPDYTSPNIDGLTNTDLTFIMSINCLTGKFNYSSETFAEKFHRYTYNGTPSGALGIIAATEVSYSFVNDAYVWGAYDNMWPDFMPSNIPNPESRMILPAFANVAGKNFLAQSSWPYNTDCKDITYNLFHHHGDAFLNVYSEVPQDLTVTTEDVHIFGTNEINVTAAQGAFIAVTYYNTTQEQTIILGTALSQGGITNIQLTECPPVATNLLVTITKQNYFRYTKDILIIAPNGSYLTCNQIEINDGTNGNNQADFSETFNLDITLKNVGSITSENISATLTESDEFITLGTNNSNIVYNNLVSNAVETSSGKFQITVANNVPDQHNAILILNMTDNSTKKSYASNISFKINAPKLTIGDAIIVDDSQLGNNDGILDPGETADLKISCKNNGHTDVTNVIGNINCVNQLITINNVSTTPIDLNILQTEDFIFNVTASNDFTLGTMVNFDLNFTAGIENQYIENATKNIVVGFVPSYCLPVYTTGTTYDDYIDGVELGDIVNLNTGSVTGPSYNDYTDMSTNLELGTSYNLKITAGNYSGDKYGAWIDYNYNGIFEDTERLGQLTLNSGITGTITFMTPATVTGLNTRLRVICAYTDDSIVACNTYKYGEIEDYTVSFETVNAGLASALETIFCESGSTTLTLANYVGDAIQWQKSTNNNVWEDINNATLNTYTTDVLTVDTYFRAKVSKTNQSVYSNSILVKIFEQTVANFTSNFQIDNLNVTFTNNSTNATTYLWNFGDTQTSTLVNPTHKYTTYKNYTVQLIAENLACSDNYSANITLISGIEDVDNIFSIYPNPTTGIFYLTLNSVENYNILITDISGKEIFNENTNSENFIKIDLKNCKAGVYVIKLTNNENTYFQKIIID